MAQDSPSRKQDQYIVRFPDGMRDRLKEAAARNGRSMNAEIVQRLEASFVHQTGVSASAAAQLKVAANVIPTDQSATYEALVRGIQIGTIEAILADDDPLAALHATRENFEKAMRPTDEVRKAGRRSK